MIDVPEGQIPTLGSRVLFTCEVPENNAYGAPVWITAQGRSIQSAGPSKARFILPANVNAILMLTSQSRNK